MVYTWRHARQNCHVQRRGRRRHYCLEYPDFLYSFSSHVDDPRPWIIRDLVAVEMREVEGYGGDGETTDVYRYLMRCKGRL